MKQRAQEIFEKGGFTVEEPYENQYTVAAEFKDLDIGDSLESLLDLIYTELQSIKTQGDNSGIELELSFDDKTLDNIKYMSNFYKMNNKLKNMPGMTSAIYIHSSKLKPVDTQTEGNLISVLPIYSDSDSDSVNIIPDIIVYDQKLIPDVIIYDQKYYIDRIAGVNNVLQLTKTFLYAVKVFQKPTFLNKFRLTIDMMKTGAIWVPNHYLPGSTPSQFAFITAISISGDAYQYAVELTQYYYNSNDQQHLVNAINHVIHAGQQIFVNWALAGILGVNHPKVKIAVSIAACVLLLSDNGKLVRDIYNNHCETETQPDSNKAEVQSHSNEAVGVIGEDVQDEVF